MDQVRTCVGCRQRDLFKNLVRVVNDQGNLSVSESSKGRGAWVHIGCMNRAIEQKGFRRSFGDAATAELEIWHKDQAEKNAGQINENLEMRSAQH